MKLKLFERRTDTELISSDKLCNGENDCFFCFAKNTVNQMEPLKPNIHRQKDDRDNVMLEQQVYCLKCNREWVDVFCRVYPDNKKDS